MELLAAQLALLAPPMVAAAPDASVPATLAALCLRDFLRLFCVPRGESRPPATDDECAVSPAAWRWKAEGEEHGNAEELAPLAKVGDGGGGSQRCMACVHGNSKGQNAATNPRCSFTDRPLISKLTLCYPGWPAPGRWARTMGKRTCALSCFDLAHEGYVPRGPRRIVTRHTQAHGAITRKESARDSKHGDGDTVQYGRLQFN